MKRLPRILPALILSIFISTDGIAQPALSPVKFDFCGYSISIDYSAARFVEFNGPLSESSIQEFHSSISTAGFEPVVAALLGYRAKHELDDWLFYQLVRKAAQQVSPKADNYHRYTLYKWFFLTRAGFDARLRINSDKLLFYTQCDENIFDIPTYSINGRQYVCLNYHDYGSIDFATSSFKEVALPVEGAVKAFTYKITRLPAFHPEDYLERNLQFSIYQNEYQFKVKLNPQIKTIFANYPTVDYDSYINIPLSSETYKSLIPLLKKNLKGLSIKNGVDYLMRFTRHAFIFEKDMTAFGKEKRLSPEQTLLYEQSDCEDRVALFYFLVKEIYNLPMIVLAYSDHVTIAVNFEKPVGNSIQYNGREYSVCEPTPQKKDLRVGDIIPRLAKAPYEVVYAYQPSR